MGCICKKASKERGETSVFSTERYNNGVALTPPMGWSSWNYFRDKIDEKSILDIARAMRLSGLADAGYTYVNLDDCWQSSMRDEDGNLQGDLNNFSKDMSKVIKKINAYGLKVGLYTSNGTLTCEDLPASLGREWQDALQLAKWGAEYFKYDFCHNEKIPSAAPLLAGLYIGKEDSNEGVIELSPKEGKLLGAAKLMTDEKLPFGLYVSGLSANNGAIEYTNVAVDEAGEYILSAYTKRTGGSRRFLMVDVNGSHYDFPIPDYNRFSLLQRTQLKINLQKGSNTIKLFNPIINRADSAMLQYRLMGKMLKKATRFVAEERGEEEKPIVFSICEWGFNSPWEWGAYTGNLWRTTPDIKAFWPWIDILYRRTVKLYKYSGVGGWNDPDMLEVGNGKLTDTENKTHFTLWCMMCAPLILGNDLRKFIDKDGNVIENSTLTILINKNLIAINQDVLGKAAKPIKLGLVDVLAKPLSDGVAICLYNRSKVNMPVSVSLKKLSQDEYVSLKPQAEYTLTEQWDGSEMKTADVLKATLPSHAVKVYKITY